jgi:hypothetical protein
MRAQLAITATPWSVNNAGKRFLGGAMSQRKEWELDDLRLRAFVSLFSKI